MSDINTSTVTPKDMVFSQTSLKTQSILKVVEIDRLKQEKPQGDGLNGGVITDGIIATVTPACSFVEDYLKPEPVFESNMYHDMDCEFAQDLAGWCSDPAKEEQVQTIDSPQKTEDRALNTDTLHTPFSPAGWDGFDANFAAAQASFYTTTPQDPLSPAEGVGPDTMFSYGLGPEGEMSLELPEQCVDIGSLPVVLGDAEPWAAPLGWDAYTKPLTGEHYTVPFIDQEDSLDPTYMKPVTPHEVENSHGVVVSEFVVAPRARRRAPGLALDVGARAPPAAPPVISTPEMLTYVVQLEQEKTPLAAFKSRHAPAQETFVSPPPAAPALPDYEPITPKSESHAESEEEAPRAPRRRRRRSEDTDETYSPHRERAAPRKYKRRKPDIPLEDMIQALSDSQQLTRARRGRPPKRRDSVVSAACSVDDNCSSMSTQEMKYRELRDKNNEASKRSRMHRKVKELQMEQEADELEEKNKKLRVQADVLEDMTRRLKDALLTSILQR